MKKVHCCIEVLGSSLSTIRTYLEFSFAGMESKFVYPKKINNFFKLYINNLNKLIKIRMIFK
jgi:hypothetical protein